MGLAAYIISVVLSLLFVPIGMIYGLIKAFWHNNFKSAFKELDDKFFSMAVSKDQYGGVACYELFNLLLIKQDSKYRFGNPDETISSVLGKNKVAGSLTGIGRFLCWFLGLFQKDHVIKSIESDEVSN